MNEPSDLAIRSAAARFRAGRASQFDLEKIADCDQATISRLRLDDISGLAKWARRHVDDVAAGGLGLVGRDDRPDAVRQLEDALRKNRSLAAAARQQVEHLKSRLQELREGVATLSKNVAAHHSGTLH